MRCYLHFVERKESFIRVFMSPDHKINTYEKKVTVLIHGRQNLAAQQRDTKVHVS